MTTNIKKQLKRISLFPKIIFPLAIIINIFLVIGLLNIENTLMLINQEYLIILDPNYIPFIIIIGLAGFTLFIGIYGIHDYLFKTQKIHRDSLFIGLSILLTIVGLITIILSGLFIWELFIR